MSVSPQKFFDDDNNKLILFTNCLKLRKNQAINHFNAETF